MGRMALPEAFAKPTVSYTVGTITVTPADITIYMGVLLAKMQLSTPLAMSIKTQIRYRHRCSTLRYPTSQMQMG